MCGIVGYIGTQNAAQVVVDGLQRLEYRGYDSAGLAVLKDGALHVRRDVGKLSNLRGRLAQHPLDGPVGIGHTRWATHGAPSERNAHPHVSADGAFVLVHNGIVENDIELRQELAAHGVVFASDTDTEVIVQLVAHYAATSTHGDLAEAVRCAARRLRGAHAIVVLARSTPGQMVAVRLGHAGGVAVGVGHNEMFLASDVPAILEHTRHIAFLESGHIVIVTAHGFAAQTLDGAPVQLPLHTIPYDPISAVKGEYRHFMQKEIFEQPRSLTDTLGGRVNFEQGTVTLADLPLDPTHARALRRLLITACGTSYYSGLVGKFYMEQLARLPTEVDYASELRYRDPVLDAHTAVLAITQSGETADTLAAMDAARAHGAPLWSIVNAVGSAAMRLSDGYITMNTGPEIGVASTKAFTASLVDQLLLAMALAQARGTLDCNAQRALARDLARLPGWVGAALEQDEAVHALAGQLYQHTNFLFLGRGINYPVALEGALKLKEISYIHAEGYPAGEMKHGPIALIDEHMPVLAIALRGPLYEKMISQIEQAKARGGRVIALATEGDRAIHAKADHVITVPDVPPLLSPIVAVVPLQLLAYHMAVWRGADVDQPRNLAKSVTVE